jgi:hypothetical protein
MTLYTKGIEVRHIATPDVIEALKQNWLQDPSWDIESTPGFEAHEKELLNFRLDMEQLWKKATELRLYKKSVVIGCQGNLELASYVEKLEERIEALEQKLADTFVMAAATLDDNTVLVCERK